MIASLKGLSDDMVDVLMRFIGITYFLMSIVMSLCLTVGIMNIEHEIDKYGLKFRFLASCIVIVAIISNVLLYVVSFNVLLSMEL